MAHFRGVIQGQRGEASRLGSKSSGMTGEVAGWECGVRLTARHELKGDGSNELIDCVYITVDGGNGYGNAGTSLYLGYVENGGVFKPSKELKQFVIDALDDNELDTLAQFGSLSTNSAMARR